MRNQVLDSIYFNSTAEIRQYTLTLSTDWDVFSLFLFAFPVSLRKCHKAHMLHTRSCVAHHVESDNTKQF